MAFQAGTVFVPVIPSLRGFQSRIAREVGGAGRQAGQSFNRSFQPEVERGASGASGRIRSAFGGLNKVMTGVAIGAGAAFTAALSRGLDVSSAQGKLSAQLGLTTKESQRVGRIAGQLYAQAYGDSMEDVSAAITSVIQNMDGMRTASSGALKETTAQAITASKVLDADVNEATRAVAQMMRTGLAKNSKEAFDILVAGAQRGANKAQDLLDTMNEYGTQFRKLGLDGKTAMGLIQQGLQGGARDADLVADALKEFSIRAVDGSDNTTAAFKSLGFNAAAVANTIAMGGPPASAALDMVLDRLRGIKNPVDQAQIATKLFGTQAEDLGQALFKIDPSKATQGLGNLTGATDRAGKAMQETAAAKFTAFRRSVETNLTNVIVNDVLPRLEDLQRAGSTLGITPSGVVQAGIALTGLALAFKTVSLAATVATASVGRFSIASTFAAGATAATQFVGGLRNVSLAYAANATMATRLGAAIRAQIVLWRAQAAAAGVSTARVIAAAAAQRVVAAATAIWTGVQWALNAALTANPIGLIVAAVALLIGGIVLAYTKVGWFRTAVNAAWAGIKTAIAAAWAFIKPVFMQIAHILINVVGTALRWYWAYVRFVFTTVWTIIQFTWNLIKPIFMAIVSFLRGTLGVAWIVLRNVIKVVWIAIQIYIKVAWTLIKGYFNLIKWYITSVLAPIFRWLYNNVIKPVWAGIKTAIGLAWAGIKAIWNALRGALAGPLSAAFRTAKSLIMAVWSAIKNHISSVYNGGIKPAFDRLKSAVGTVKNAFKAAVDGIKAVWDRLKNIAKVPVNFVIGLYNDGIVNLVNKIAGVAGIKTRLDKIPKFRTGGILPGYSPGVDSLVAAVSPGEAIMRPEFTRAVGSGFVHSANDVARRSGVEGVRKWLHGPGAIGGEGMAFARGGIVPGFAGQFGLGGIVDGFVKGVKDFTIGNVGAAAKGLLGKILSPHVPGSGILRDVIAQIPAWIKDKILGWVTSKAQGGVGGKGVQRALAYARAQAGKPYVWGGVGPGGFDCSGFMSALTNVIKGRSPNSRLFTTHNFTGATNGPQGFVEGLRSGFTVGVTNAGVGHMAGTLGGVNVESSGSAGVHMGPSARGTSNSMFGMKYGLKFDDGGLLHKGLNLAYHGTNRPDRVLTDSQWNAIYGAAQGTDGPATSYTINARTADFTVRDLEVLQRKQDARARIGRPR